MEKKEKFSFLEGAWIFVIGCFIGFILETVFYVIKYGEFVNKQGLFYGPFKPIYGFGALLSTAIYYIVKKKTYLRFFLVGTVIGAIFEYVSSWIIETLYHSYIWDYSSFKYNINGRVYLPYCFAWGLITLVWAKIIYPWFKNKYDKLNLKKHFKKISIIVAILIIFDFLITQVILVKETLCSKNSNFYKIVDKCYPHDTVVKKFPKFRPIE